MTTTGKPQSHSSDQHEAFPYRELWLADRTCDLVQVRSIPEGRPGPRGQLALTSSEDAYVRGTAKPLKSLA